jgi:hypothetical protein
MAKIEFRINALGLVLPPAFTPPPGLVLPFVNVRLIGNRAMIAGHGPQSPEGPLAQPSSSLPRCASAFSTNYFQIRIIRRQRRTQTN